MIFESFADSYGWKKEYILGRMTFPQIMSYLKSKVKRKELEALALEGITKGRNVEQVKEGVGTETMRNSDLPDFHLGRGKKTTETEV